MTEIKKSPKKDMLFLGLVLLYETLIFNLADFIFDGKIKNEALYGTLVSIVGLVVPVIYAGYSVFFNGLKQKNKRMTAVIFVLLFSLIFVLNFVISGLTDMFLYDILNLNPQNDEATENTGFMAILYSAVLAPVFEELLYRGVVLKHTEKYGGAFAIIASSLLFSLMHQNASQIPATFAGGLVIGYAAHRYSFKWAVVLHILNNLSVEISTLFGEKKETYADTFEYVLLGASILFIVIYFIKNGNTVKSKLEFFHEKCRLARRKEKNDSFKLFFTSISIVILIIYHITFTVLGELQ